MQKILDEYKNVKVFSVNAIDMAGKVKSEVRRHNYSFTYLIGRGSNIISLYGIEKLPKIVIIGKDRKIKFVDKYVKYEKLKEEVSRILSE